MLMDGRLSWRSWLTHSEQFTHKVVTCQPSIGCSAGKVCRPKTDVLTSELGNARNVLTLQNFFTRQSQIFRQNLTRTKSSTKLDRNAKKAGKDSTKAGGDAPESGDGGDVVTMAGRLVPHDPLCLTWSYAAVDAFTKASSTNSAGFKLVALCCCMWQTDSNNGS